MPISYYVPKSGTSGQQAEDYNPQVYKNGTAQAVDWLTPEEFAERFPAPEPEPPTLEKSRTAKIAEINAGYDTVISWVQAGYPLKEVLSWETQAAQARTLQDDPQAEALFVRALAATKGVSVEEMAGRILDNARNWEPVAAMLTAQRQLMEEAAEKARSVEEVEAVKVGYRV